MNNIQICSHCILDTNDDPDITFDNDGWIVDGSITLRELNKKLRLSLPLNGPKTLNGLIIEFFEEQKNLDRINCFSDEGNGWDKSKINLVENKLYIEFREKFSFRRGRINCSLHDDIGWRWLGIQFSIEQN